MVVLLLSNLPSVANAFVSTQFSLVGAKWNRISDGKFRPDDQARALWKVEAAPIGALATFELERDEATGQWIIRSL